MSKKIIKKTSQVTPISAQVVNTHVESETDAYSANYINTNLSQEDSVPVGAEFEYNGEEIPEGYEVVDDPSTYSINETKVGTWINGKPLYQKTLVYNNYINVNANHQIANVDIIWVDLGSSFGVEVDSPYWSFNQGIWSGNIRPQMIVNKTTILAQGVENKHYNWYITVKYTKTTD